MFVYKHRETIEYVKKLPTFFKKRQTSRVNNTRILMIENPKCCFIETRTYNEGLKSALVYL